MIHRWDKYSFEGIINDINANGKRLKQAFVYFIRKNDKDSFFKLYDLYPDGIIIKKRRFSVSLSDLICYCGINNNSSLMIDLIKIKKNQSKNINKQYLIKKIVSLNEDFIMDVVLNLMKEIHFDKTNLKTLIHCIVARDFDKVLHKYFLSKNKIKDMIKSNVELLDFFDNNVLMLNRRDINDLMDENIKNNKFKVLFVFRDHLTGFLEERTGYSVSLDITRLMAMLKSKEGISTLIELFKHKNIYSFINKHNNMAVRLFYIQLDKMKADFNYEEINGQRYLFEKLFLEDGNLMVDELYESTSLDGDLISFFIENYNQIEKIQKIETSKFSMDIQKKILTNTL